AVSLRAPRGQGLRGCAPVNMCFFGRLFTMSLWLTSLLGHSIKKGRLSAVTPRLPRRKRCLRSGGGRQAFLDEALSDLMVRAPGGESSGPRGSLRGCAPVTVCASSSYRQVQADVRGAVAGNSTWPFAGGQGSVSMRAEIRLLSAVRKKAARSASLGNSS